MQAQESKHPIGAGYATYLSFVELHGGVHPCVWMISHTVRAHPRALVPLVRCLEVSLARELVIS